MRAYLVEPIDFHICDIIYMLPSSGFDYNHDGKREPGNHAKGCRYDSIIIISLSLDLSGNIAGRVVCRL